MLNIFFPHLTLISFLTKLFPHPVFTERLEDPAPSVSSTERFLLLNITLKPSSLVWIVGPVVSGAREGRLNGAGCEVAGRDLADVGRPAGGIISPDAADLSIG